MGTTYYWKCTTCTNEIELDTFFEFYRDAQGHLHPYGHPQAISLEALKSGVKGYYSRLYCPKCRQIREAIEIEFAEHDRSGNKGNGCTRIIDLEFSDKVCDVCGSMLLTKPDNSIICPKCNQGHLIYSCYGIS